MKNSKKNCLSLWFPLSLTMALILAFKVGDQIELEAFLNARSSARFLKRSHNIKTTLSKGTLGEVLETKKMPSGNFGIKIKVDNGHHRGESYWVYHNLKTPLIKLFNADNKEQVVKPESAIKPESESGPAQEVVAEENRVAEARSENTNEEIAQVKKAELTADQIAYRDSEEAALTNAATITHETLDKKNISEMTAIPKSSNCAPLGLSIPMIPEDQYNETTIVEPFREVVSSAPGFPSISTTAFGWDQSKSDKGKIEGFQLVNGGPNKIIKTNENSINRIMSFEYEDRARSEIKLLITDVPDYTTSHATYSIMLFFPRSVLPAIKKIGDELEVTLPNRETVRYNAKTREIIGGVFTEGPMAQDQNKKALPANIKYTGNGVMIRADKTGDLPYGDIELKGGKNAPSITTATISKKGFKDCKVPSKEIWYTDYNRGSNVYIKPELGNDLGMDQFVKKKCGFSLVMSTK